MALTNDQITAQNFKDFYNQIRPYLNGNVPTFANTFNKSDLYSTSEKMIGTYLGKPLYQKTYVFPNENATSFTCPLGVSDIDLVLLVPEGSCVDSHQHNVIRQPLPYYQTATDWISVRASLPNIAVTKGNAGCWCVNNADLCVTLRYTKTTDSSVTISDGTEYSTDEQVVGHWIDDSILYQKTFIIPVTNLTNVQQNLGSISGINFKDGFISDFYFFEEDYYLGMGDVSVWIRKPEQNFGFRATNTATRNGTAYVTVRYTKN